MSKNLLGSSEFLNAMGTLAQGVLAGQPNAIQSGAWQMSESAKKQARALAMQEALKKQEDEEKKKKKGKLGSQIGSTLLGLAAAPLTAGMSVPLMMGTTAAASAAGSLAGGALGGDMDLKSSLMDGAASGLSAGITSGVGDKLMRGAVGGQPASAASKVTADGAGFINKPMKYRLGQAINNMSGLNITPDSSYTLKRQRDGSTTLSPGGRVRRSPSPRRHPLANMNQYGTNHRLGLNANFGASI